MEKQPPSLYSEREKKTERDNGEFRKMNTFEYRKSYLPARRIVWSSNCDAQGLIGNELCQCSFHWENDIQLPAGSALLLDFGCELAGGAAIITRSAGRCRLRFGESASEAMGSPDQTHAIHDTELQLPALGTFEYGTTGFRFLRIDALEPLTLQNILAVSLECPAEECGSFECSDPRLNLIWETARRTVRLCMGNYLFDGVKRDRLVWMGDLYPELKSVIAAYGCHEILPRSLDYVRDDTPLPATMNNITSYSLWWIVCQSEYFRVSGRLDYLKEQHSYLRNLAKQFASYIDEAGAEHLPGRRFLDWPSNDDDVAKHAGLQGLMAFAFRRGAELAAALGDGQLLELCRTTITRLSNHRPECTGNKTAAALQILGGIADRSETLLSSPGKNISTFGGAFVLDAMAQLDKIEEGVQLIRSYWGAMIDRGATTFWEDFNLDWLENSGRIDELPPPGVRDLHADFGNYCYKGLRHSLCHGWASAPCFWLSETLSGVRFLSPGGGELSVTPRLAGLQWMRIGIPTPRGPVTIEQEAGKVPEIRLPEGVRLVPQEPCC